MKRAKLIVIAGGSSNGKTSILEELGRRGYNIHKEVARGFLEERQKEISYSEYINPSKDEQIYRQENIYQRQLDLEENICSTGGVHFLERGLIDNCAFSKCYIGSYIPKISSNPPGKYSAVFIPDRLPFQQDGLRTEKDDSQVQEIHERIILEYFQRNHRPHMLPVIHEDIKTSVEKRADLIMEIAAEEGHLEDVYRFNSNADWDEKIKWMKDNNEPLKKIHYKLYDYFSSESSERVFNPTQVSDLIQKLAPGEGFSKGDSESVLSCLESEKILINIEGRR